MSNNSNHAISANNDLILGKIKMPRCNPLKKQENTEKDSYMFKDKRIENMMKNVEQKREKDKVQKLRK